MIRPKERYHKKRRNIDDRKIKLYRIGILTVSNPNFLTFIKLIYPKEFALYKTNIACDISLIN